MRNHHCEIYGMWFLFNGVHILRKGFPIPINSFVQCSTRDVFDTFHQFNEALPIFGPARCKANPAITQYSGCYTVINRRLKLFIPRHLAIIMRVHVDKPRRHQTAIGINNVNSLLTNRIFDCDYFPCFYGDCNDSRWRSITINKFCILYF